MTYHRDTNKCKKHPVPICQIEDRIKEKQLEFFKKYGRYLSVPRAIIQLILDK
jgi:hypothetical protein